MPSFCKRYRLYMRYEMDDDKRQKLEKLSEREKKVLIEKFNVDLITGEGLEALKNLDYSVEAIERMTEKAMRKLNKSE